jgi:hypothetical protein
MLRYLLRNPQEKRIVDVKGFVQKWTESGNYREDDDERIAGCGILHPQPNSRLNLSLEASKARESKFARAQMPGLLADWFTNARYALSLQMAVR